MEKNFDKGKIINLTYTQKKIVQRLLSMRGSGQVGQAF